jgi:hypothetical protein
LSHTGERGTLSDKPEEEERISFIRDLRGNFMRSGVITKLPSGNMKQGLSFHTTIRSGIFISAAVTA